MRISKFLVLLFFILACSCHKQEETAMDEKCSGHECVKSTIERSCFLKYDFGEVDKDQIITGTVKLKNEDDKPIVLESNRTTCGCLSIKSMPKKIEPGETGVFEITLNTTGRRGLQTLQAIFWDAEPMKCLVKLNATAMIRSCWTTPETISLGNLVASDSVKKDLFVDTAGYPDAKVLSISTDAKWITLKKKKVGTSPQLQADGIKAIDCYEVEWNGKDVPPGKLSAKITVRIKTDKEQTLDVPVTGYLSGDAVITPVQLVFGSIAKAEVVRSCTLKFNHPVDIAEIKVTAEHPSIKVEVAKDENVPNQFIMTARASVPDTMSGKLLQGSIVGIDIDGTSIFHVPYTGIVNIMD